MSKGVSGRTVLNAGLASSLAALTAACSQSSDRPPRSLAGDGSRASINRPIFSETEYGVSSSPRVVAGAGRPVRKGGGTFLVKGGKVVMVEPANSALGRFIYKRFHHEPFVEDGPREIEPGNPLSNSNQALPYIYFERDLEKFRKDFPKLKIVSIKYHSPFMYVLSGGVSRSAMVPYFMYEFFKGLEKLLSPLNRQIGLFCTVVLEKQ